jgi:antitoxin HicB
MLRYPLHLEPDDNDTLLVTCPLLPEVTTFGDNEADALHHGIAAVEEELAARIAEGRDIPMPQARSRLPTAVLSLMASLKVLLYLALREDKVTRAELSRRLKWNRESVDRLFRLDHASRLDQVEAAFRALGRSIAIKVEETA